MNIRRRQQAQREAENSQKQSLKSPYPRNKEAAELSHHDIMAINLVDSDDEAAATAVCPRCTLENLFEVQRCGACNFPLGSSASSSSSLSCSSTTTALQKAAKVTEQHQGTALQKPSSEPYSSATSSSSNSSISSSSFPAQRSILNYFGAADGPPKPGTVCPRVDVDIIPGAWVLRYAIGKEVKSWSKIYVPLIFSALGTVPSAAGATVHLSRAQAVSTDAQLGRAQGWWAARFSKWGDWVAAVRRVVEREGLARFVGELLMRPPPRGKTTLVFGDGAGFGWLPHIVGRTQEQVMAMAGIDGEIATCVSFSTT